MRLQSYQGPIIIPYKCPAIFAGVIGIIESLLWLIYSLYHIISYLIQNNTPPEELSTFASAWYETTIRKGKYLPDALFMCNIVLALLSILWLVGSICIVRTISLSGRYLNRMRNERILTQLSCSYFTWALLAILLALLDITMFYILLVNTGKKTENRTEKLEQQVTAALSMNSLDEIIKQWPNVLWPKRLVENRIASTDYNFGMYNTSSLKTFPSLINSQTNEGTISNLKKPRVREFVIVPYHHPNNTDVQNNNDYFFKSRLDDSDVDIVTNGTTQGYDISTEKKNVLQKSHVSQFLAAIFTRFGALFFINIFMAGILLTGSFAPFKLRTHSCQCGLRTMRMRHNRLWNRMKYPLILTLRKRLKSRKHNERKLVLNYCCDNLPNYCDKYRRFNQRKRSTSSCCYRNDTKWKHEQRSRSLPSQKHCMKQWYSLPSRLTMCSQQTQQPRICATPQYSQNYSPLHSTPTFRPVYSKPTNKPVFQVCQPVYSLPTYGTRCSTPGNNLECSIPTFNQVYTPPTYEPACQPSWSTNCPPPAYTECQLPDYCTSQNDYKCQCSNCFNSQYNSPYYYHDSVNRKPVFNIQPAFCNCRLHGGQDRLRRGKKWFRKFENFFN